MRSFGTEISGNRGKQAELSPEQRAGICSALDAGVSASKLAVEYACHRSTIYRTRERFLEQKNTSSRPRTGRPPIFNERARKYIYLQARRNPLWSYKRLGANSPGHPSRTTIRRIYKA
ncbi:hypothetical protein PENPOL_c038G02850 [Penicillium polonicum]|uniref:Transposase IS30-like HTH domain-containing protein n=1 Tax=Penicillium polonicum TaxID=60169 RepID=A0A1V6N642_PENPO|nr:hypothetical protein PENPOL_c038G02850 [Penicillium polonicum]